MTSFDFAQAASSHHSDDTSGDGHLGLGAPGRCDLCRLANSVRDLGRQHLRELESRIRRRGLSNRRKLTLKQIASGVVDRRAFIATKLATETGDLTPPIG